MKLLTFPAVGPPPPPPPAVSHVTERFQALMEQILLSKNDDLRRISGVMAGVTSH